MRNQIIAGLAIAAIAAAGAGYALLERNSTGALTAQARAEREIIVWGNADTSAVAPLISVFRNDHPDLSVRYVELTAGDLYRHFVTPGHKGLPDPDIVWSSSMDLQAKLINDGYAQSYHSPESAALPPTAIWKNQGYGVTAEPVAIVYNKTMIAPRDVPRTHQALEQLLNRDRAALRGKIATYDPARSNIGYLFLTQDQAITRDTRSLLVSIAATHPILSATTEPMMEAVASGRAALAYNVVGPYALKQAAIDPQLGVIFPSDYTLVASRVAFIAHNARHPAGARLYLDFMLSHQGQALLARAALPPVRTDLAASRPALAQARPIRGGPQLFVNLDPIKRRRFLAEWDSILAEGTKVE